MSLSASWRISLHIVPNDLLNSESSYYYYYYYYYYCYCCCYYFYYYYTASCIISLWEEYHSIPHPPHGKVIPLQDHTHVTQLALGAFEMVCMASVETHAHHFKNIKAFWEMLYLLFEMLYVESENGFVFFEMVCACLQCCTSFSFVFAFALICHCTIAV